MRIIHTLSFGTQLWYVTHITVVDKKKSIQIVIFIRSDLFLLVWIRICWMQLYTGDSMDLIATRDVMWIILIFPNTHHRFSRLHSRGRSAQQFIATSRTMSRSAARWSIAFICNTIAAAMSAFHGIAIRCARGFRILSMLLYMTHIYVCTVYDERCLS